LAPYFLKKEKISLLIKWEIQQENNREKGKNKYSYVAWSTNNRELLLLLVDATNRGLRDVNESLDKQNVDQIILF